MFNKFEQIFECEAKFEDDVVKKKKERERSFIK